MAGLPHRITSGMTGGADEGNDVELEEIGLDAGFVEVAISQGIVPRSLGRVVRIDRGWASVQRRTALDRLELRDCPQIAVGDWIGLDGTGANVRVERRSALVRRSVSERVEAQYMAANVDLVVIVYALDTEISDSRLTELIVMARDSGAEPLVVLTKADKSDDLEGVLHRVEEIAAGIEVIVVSSVTAMGLERFRDFVRNKTIVLLGASGAGKSTLTNALLLAEAQETGEVRRKGEGRHTTTSRQLLGIPGGGAVIDTPGIREVSMWSDGDGVALTFPELDELAMRCRFSDCTHRGIAGCAIDVAIEAGTISADRRDAYLLFVEELAAVERDREALQHKIDKAQNRRGAKPRHGRTGR